MPRDQLQRTAVPGMPVRRALSKVPEVTVYFWITKVLTTGMGEVTSDYLANQGNRVVAGGLAAVVLVVFLALQFRARRYVAWIYWTAVVMVSVVGTMGADIVHVMLGIPYVVSTTFFLIVLASIFVAWHATERTLSIHSIHTRRREAFYWLTVMATFALGTAAGDLTARTLGLGYFGAGVVFAVAIAVPAIAHAKLGMNAVLAFWIAYVLTRPLGASFADWLGMPPSRGGVGLGLGQVSLGLTVLIVGFVGYLAVTRRDVEADDLADYGDYTVEANLNAETVVIDRIR